jgi:hypothetical protein
MAVAEAKELVQALAFAHFGVYDLSVKSHEQKFLDLFDPTIEIPPGKITEYKNLLSKGFPFDNLTRGTVGKTTYIKRPDPAIKDKTPKDDVTVRIVYLVANELYKKNILKKPWSNYLFLDQNDSFVINTKDTVLNRIIDALNLNIKPDILSSADIIAVNKNKKNVIESEIMSNHVNVDMIRSNMATGQNTIRTIVNKYFNSRELIPISLKLPGSISAPKHVSIVGRTTGRYAEPKINDTIIDPYSKFIALAGNKKNNLKILINDLITIKFNEFKITSTRLNWEFPITFNYDKVYGKNAKGMKNKTPISDMAYNFDLFAQGYGSGFNGQFKSGKTGNQWVGGAGIETFETFFNQYQEYSKVIGEVCKLREEAFNYATTGDKNKEFTSSNQYLTIFQKRALGEIKTKHVLTGGREKHLIKFFEEFDRWVYLPVQGEKTVNKVKVKYDLPYSYYRYIAHFVRSVKSSMRGVTETVFHQFLVGKGKNERSALPHEKMERLKAHYVHGQCSWFLLRGGPSLNLYLKKRLFLTIFGVIAKKGYMIYDGDFDGKMKSALSKEFDGKLAEFVTIPHVYLS